jgi:hypothetical protein
VEARRLGVQILNPVDYNVVKAQLSQVVDTQTFLEGTNSEVKISQQLAAC